MLFIPSAFVALITFPGVIIHELSHQMFCRICRVAILDVCYFRTKNPYGYVVHETPRNTYQHILIGIGPFILNTLIGALIALPAVIPVMNFKTPLNNMELLADYALIWLGVSIAMHSFPSTGDAKSIWQAIKSKETPLIAKIIGAPIVLLIYIGAAGSVIWLDLAYGIVVVTFLPNLIIKLLA